MKNTKEAKNFTSLVNALDTFLSQKLKQINTFLPVKILEVNSGTVDVQVLIQSITADNQAFSGPKIFNCPYLTYSAGKNAFLLTPEVGDIGLMGFFQRDASKVISTKGSESLPGSLRTFSFSDGIYLGSILFKPEAINNSIELVEGGITIKAEKELSLKSQQTMSFNAAGTNFARILKEVCESIVQACAQPVIPGKPVLDPATVAQLLVKLGQLQNFGA